MPVSAHDIAAALRAASPGLPVKKLHKLLYYCQGHHLAWFNEPLFAETVEAWDMGPVVPALWRAEKRDTPAPDRAKLTTKELNTVGYVLSRYGSLTGKDLEILSHGEDPWREADRHRPTGSAVRIEHDALTEWFHADHDERSPGPEVFAELDRRAAAQRMGPDKPDNLNRLRARRDEYAARAATAKAAAR